MITPMMIPPIAPITYDQHIGLGDDRIRDAQQQAKAEAYRPAGPRQTGSAYHETQSQTGDQSRRDCGLFIGEAYIGIIIPMSIAPNTKPQTMPSRTLDMDSS